MEYIVTLSEEQEKALLTDMISVQDWIDNAIQNKARQMIDSVCEQALNDHSNTILTVAEKQDVVTSLASAGSIITTVKQMPEAVKMMIVQKARVKSAAEMHAESESL